MKVSKEVREVVRMLEIMRRFIYDSSYKRTGCELQDIDTALEAYKKKHCK